MLKKIAHIIFAFLILLGSTGMTISKHYCGSTLESIGVNITTDNCCDTPMDCCHIESITVKIEDDFAIATNIFDFNNPAFTLGSSTDIFQEDVFVKESSKMISWVTPSPPKIQKSLSSLQSFLL
jgi:hypothetical protein